jgi:hypothetical protein
MPKKAATRRDNRVFLNLPFDESYEPVLVASVSALAALGLRARAVLEIAADGAHRLDRLLGIIEDCGASLHDLSWVALDDGKYPRFNMPFELGLAVAIARRARPPRRFFLLERERHRLSRTLSDLGGFDQLVYNGAPDRLLGLLHAHFHGPPPRPDLAALREVHLAIRRLLPSIKAQHGGTLFSADAFGALVAAASETAARIVGR